MLINFLLFTSTLFLFCGLALDIGMLQLRKLQLQHAADAAALGAMYEAARGQTDWAAAGKADASMNGFTDGSNGVTISIVNPPTSGSYSGDSSAFQAIVKQTVHVNFLGLVSGSSTTVGTSAVGKTSPNPDCVYIMGAGTYIHSIQNQGFSGIYSACNIYMDSTNNSLENDLGSTVSVTGSNTFKIRGSSGTAWLWGTMPKSPTFDSAQETDPLSYVTAPTFSSCTYNNLYLLLTTVTLNPGTYCNLVISASTVTFNPGLYIMVGGVNWNTGSTIYGTGVTFYLTKGGAYSSYSNFNIYNSTVTLSAPTSSASGGITGVVVFADRNWVNSGGQNIFLSASYVSTDGIWYAPNIGIWNFASTLKGTNYLGVVTDNMYFDSATFTIPSPNYSSLSGGSPYLGSGGGGIVE